MTGRARQKEAHPLTGFSTWFRRRLPAPPTHLPSDEEMEHTEGSGPLAEGKFEVTGDLVESDADSIEGA